MKTPSSDVGGEQSLTSVEYRKVGPSKAAYNPYLPYDDNYTTTASTALTQPCHHQNLLVPPPSRTNSRGRQTTFTEPGSLAAGARDQSNLLTGEGLFSLNSLIFPFYYISLLESANLTRGRQRTRTFFNTIKRKLSGTRSQSSSLQSQTANGNHYHLMCGEKW